MKNLRKRFDVFCYRNRNKGIPNLMLYISLGAGLTYLFTLFGNNTLLYSIFYFDRALILQGQIWRLFTYPLVYDAGNILLTAITLLCYYSLGRAMENLWGTLKFNLFYLTGVVMMDVYCLIFGGQADVSYLNMSLFLSYATLYPDAHFLLLFIIPVKAWIFALLDLVLVVVGLVTYPFPYNLFSVVSLANYFLFFGKDVVNVIPLSWRINARKLFKRKPRQQKSKVVPFPGAGSYQASTATAKAPYTHRCTVCGRTDVSDPDLEFRYCSRCKGYYCYCIDHINNHVHIQ
ncbi:MAG: rhomboid family intramembrane serine protease [Firmicutes bacterium]|nr:rhomboid family intramembrane serine protease [Bacillota bacterium]